MYTHQICVSFFSDKYRCIQIWNISATLTLQGLDIRIVAYTHIILQWYCTIHTTQPQNVAYNRKETIHKTDLEKKSQKWPWKKWSLNDLEEWPKKWPPSCVQSSQALYKQINMFYVVNNKQLLCHNASEKDFTAASIALIITMKYDPANIFLPTL